MHKLTSSKSWTSQLRLASGLSPDHARLTSVLFLSLLALDLLLCLLHLVQYSFGLGGWEWMVNLAGEGNLPTWFATITWLAAGAASAACYRTDKGLKRSGHACWPWLVIALVCLVAAVDESAQIHERLGRYLAGEAHLSAWRHFLGSPDSAWIWLALPVLGITVVALFGFLWSRFQKLPLFRAFIVAAAAFFALALAIDYWEESPDWDVWLWKTAVRYNVTAKLVEDTVAVVAEESFEHLGTALLLTGLFAYALSTGVELKADGIDPDQDLR